MTVLAKTAILYIEDDAGIAYLVRKRLETYGYLIELADSGRKGLDKYDASIHDLVIADYQLPDMDGCQIIRELKEKNNFTPIIMLTGAGNEKIVIEAFKLGVADYLVKDVNQVFLELLPNITESALFTKNLVKKNESQQKELEYYAKELEERNKELQKLAQHDALTGLANRAVFHEALQGAIARAHRNSQNMALLLIDLDGFKSINDTYGHQAGDLFLKEISARFKSILRESDHIARIGGDEFAVILEDLHDPQDAAIVANKLLASMRQPITVENQEVKITVSIGIDSYPSCGQDAVQLIKNADAALYLAKKEGKNACQFFTPELNRQTMELAELEKDLSGALKRGEMYLHFQPKFNMAASRIIGAEALIRWTHPEKGNVGPNIFIPIAERSPLIQEIGIWVLKTACRQGHAWQKEGLAPLLISVNVSPQQLKEKDFAEKVFNILESCKFPPESLELEITETSLLKNIDRCRDTLKRLRKKGIKISVDDFGTGYSSIAHLRQLPVDILKIDKSLIRHIATDVDEAAIASAVIDLAHNINLEVAAEGVETAEQLKFLQSRNCDALQGFFLGRPMPVNDFAKAMKKKKAA